MEIKVISFLSAQANPSASTFYQSCCCCRRTFYIFENSSPNPEFFSSYLNSFMLQDPWPRAPRAPRAKFSMSSILIQIPLKYGTNWTLITRALFPEKIQIPTSAFIFSMSEYFSIKIRHCFIIFLLLWLLLILIYCLAVWFYSLLKIFATWLHFKCLSI